MPTQGGLQVDEAVCKNEISNEPQRFTGAAAHSSNSKAHQVDEKVDWLRFEADKSRKLFEVKDIHSVSWMSHSHPKSDALSN